jgi:hypothetical protein
MKRIHLPMKMARTMNISTSKIFQVGQMLLSILTSSDFGLADIVKLMTSTNQCGLESGAAFIYFCVVLDFQKFEAPQDTAAGIVGRALLLPPHCAV